jgi:putative peptide zinc metalloprotease protein
MSEAAALTSEQWFRVSALRPKFDLRARVQRVRYRRQPWHVVTRADGTRSFRLNATAYAFVARCNGTLTLQRLWEVLLQEWQDEAPSQDELLRLLAKLHAAALMSFDRRPDFGPQGVLVDTALAQTAAAQSSLLSMRVPLGRPEWLLDALYPHLRRLFSPAVLWAWLAVVGVAALAALVNLKPLMHLAQQAMFTPRMLILTWACYPTVKVLHEIAHGLAVRHLGARVPEWGVTVMMFVPVPYVDASGTSAYAARRQRLLVSSAGIVVELFLASIGLAVALNAQPGWLHDIGLAVFLIGAVSTLLVNGNPLMRFDGYHMLCDALSLPNLAMRSARWWQELLRRRVLGETISAPMVCAPGERVWVWAYAPASLAWRWLVVFGLVLWLAQLSFLLGLAIALVMGWGMVVKPLVAFVRHLLGLQASASMARRASLRGWGVLAAGACLLALVPMPFSSVVQGVVWPEEEALMRAGSEGFVARVLVRNGAAVQPGQALLQLASPTLEAERQALAARAQALSAERYQTLHADPGRAASLEREIFVLEVEQARLQERLDNLTLRAQVAGRAALTNEADLQGRYLKQGALVGHVVQDEPSKVRVALGQEQAGLLQAAAPIQVRLAEIGQPAWPATLERDTRAAVHRLPSAALGDTAGGHIATDPKDPQGLTATQAVVLADVRLPVNVGERMGARAWVRFDHGHAPLVVQAARGFQQVFLRHFNPAQ